MSVFFRTFSRKNTSPIFWSFSIQSLVSAKTNSFVFQLPLLIPPSSNCDPENSPWKSSSILKRAIDLEAGLEACGRSLQQILGTKFCRIWTNTNIGQSFISRGKPTDLFPPLLPPAGFPTGGQEQILRAKFVLLLRLNEDYCCGAIILLLQGQILTPLTLNESMFILVVSISQVRN